MNGCVFCEILAGRLPASVLLYDEHCTAFMDIRPTNPGHVLVMPRDHAASLSDPEDAGAHVFRVGQRVAGALYRSRLLCEGINLSLADGKAAVQEIFHVHLHVVPRFGGDGFGLPFSSLHGGEPGRDELDGLADRIRNAL